MPTVTVNRPVTLQGAAQTRRERLGSRYDVTLHGTDANGGLKVRQSAAASATVHLEHDRDATMFHVHGRGLVISRMVNGFGIAKRVITAIGDTYAPPDPDGTDGRA